MASRSLPSDVENSFIRMLFFRQLHLGFNMLFYQFYAKITTFFDQEMFGSAPLLYVDVETDVKMTSRRQTYVKTSESENRNSHTDVMHESRLTPPHVRRHFLAPVGFTDIPVGYG